MGARHARLRRKNVDNLCYVKSYQAPFRCERCTPHRRLISVDTDFEFLSSHPAVLPIITAAVKHVFSMLDLFGDVIITHEDLEAWVTAVAPAFAVNDRSIKRYIRFWDVAHKVRQAKLGGYFESTIENARDRRAFLSRRFGLY